MDIYSTTIQWFPKEKLMHFLKIEMSLFCKIKKIWPSSIFNTISFNFLKAVPLVERFYKCYKWLFSILWQKGNSVPQQWRQRNNLHIHKGKEKKNFRWLLIFICFKKVDKGWNTNLRRLYKADIFQLLGLIFFRPAFPVLQKF